MAQLKCQTILSAVSDETKEIVFSLVIVSETCETKIRLEQGQVWRLKCWVGQASAVLISGEVKTSNGEFVTKRQVTCRLHMHWFHFHHDFLQLIDEAWPQIIRFLDSQDRTGNRDRVFRKKLMKEEKINFHPDQSWSPMLEITVFDSRLPAPPQNTSLLSVIVQFEVYPQAAFNQL